MKHLLLNCLHLLPVIVWANEAPVNDRRVRSNTKTNDGKGESCIREFEGFRLAGELPITRLPTRLRRDCIVSCIRSDPPCAAAVFDKRNDVSQSSCVLYANNTVIVHDSHLKLVPSHDGEGESMTVFELLPACPTDSSHTHTIAVHQTAPRFASLLPGANEWSAWSGWSDCSLECGGGDQFRQRRCLNCAGDKQPSQQQARRCNTQPCGIDRLSVRNTYGAGVQSWSEWSQWSGCFAGTAGGGTVSSRSRTCPTYGGCGDETLSVESRNCDQGVSQSTSTEWEQWNAWSQCSASCGQGTQSRNRQCIIIEQYVRPAPLSTGYNNVQAAPAPNYPTSNNIGYSRRRISRQAYGGGGTGGVSGGTTTCTGSSTDSQSCTARACPSWLQWGPWGSCTVTCGNGRRERTRSCDQGNACFGQNVESQPCGDACTDWTQWTAWSSCTASCGRGQKKRTRQCQIVNPVSSVSGTNSYNSGGGGSSYGGSNVGVHQPNYPPAPAGNPYRRRKSQRSRRRRRRQSYGGGGGGGGSSGGGGLYSTGGSSFNTDLAPGQCPGISEEVMGCDAGACPTWGPWQSWSLCSVSCGQGTQSRSRDCENGYGCNGDVTQTQNCNCGACPSWGNWGGWGSCSATCDYGSQSRTRPCSNYDINRPDFCQPRSNVPSGGVEQGYSNDYNSYATGGSTGGSSSGYRHLTAVKAVHARARQRSKRQSQYTANAAWPAAGTANANSYATGSGGGGYGGSSGGGGSSYVTSGSDECTGKTVEYKACQQSVCPTWGQWGQWSSCSTSCGAGQITRGRQCNGNGCLGDDAQQKFCDNPACCEWAAWQQWSSCSVSCGQGQRSRGRTSNQGGGGGGGSGNYGGSPSGFPCEGPAQETEQCTGSAGSSCQQQCQWATWNAWGSCSVTCGSGSQVRTRQCSCYGDCGPGQTSQSQQCTQQQCDQFVGGGYGQPQPQPTYPTQSGYRRQRLRQQRLRQQRQQRLRQAS